MSLLTLSLSFPFSLTFVQQLKSECTNISAVLSCYQFVVAAAAVFVVLQQCSNTREGERDWEQQQQKNWQRSERTKNWEFIKRFRRVDINKNWNAAQLKQRKKPILLRKNTQKVVVLFFLCENASPAERWAHPISAPLTPTSSSWSTTTTLKRRSRNSQELGSNPRLRKQVLERRRLRSKDLLLPPEQGLRRVWGVGARPSRSWPNLTTRATSVRMKCDPVDLKSSNTRSWVQTIIRSWFQTH